VTHTGGGGTGTFSGGSNSITYSGVEQFSFTSGSGNDTYNTTISGQLSENVNAAAGTDTLRINHSGQSSALSVSASVGYGWSASAYDSGTYSSGYFNGFEVLEVTGGSGDDTFYTYDLFPAALHGGAGVDTWTANLSTQSRTATIAPSETLSGIERMHLTLGLGQYTVEAGDEAGEGSNGDSLTINYGSLTSDVTHTGGGGAGTFSSGSNSITYSGVEQLSFTSGSGDDTYNTTISGQLSENVNAAAAPTR
jgi:hypothetical protein